ncbi:peptidoglycan DD-metalloendopeptidase family protein [Bosea sp. 117]|uniref:murein hydrolase activator EnvC family protein n=1 Tax=Bosea sp. 117 TaxID=1125973 RepID=UPI00049400B8|nr:peptidoglycan DD-metalloendopeptidase family protein [Bosea sp. 117]
MPPRPLRPIRRLNPLAAALCGAGVLLPLLAGPLAGQQAEQSSGKTVGQQADDPAGKVAEQQRKIEEIDSQIQGSAAEQARLQAEIAAIRGDRAKLASALIDTATRIREVEGKLDASENRLRELAREEKGIRASLDGRRDVIAQVLGALARLGRQPPPALLVRPDDALESVRSAMLLGAVLPELKEETEILIGELTSLDRVRKEASAQRDALAELKTSIGEDRRRIAALIDQRQRNQEAGEAALTQERQRAETLAAQSRNVRELMDRMETEIAAAKRAAEAAQRAAEAAQAAENKPAQGPRERLAALKDPGRLSPSVAFVDAKGLLPPPVGGAVLKQFGMPDGYGGAEKGTSFGTRSEAQVSAPADGWVVYAGPFRSYGQLLIINAGGGYHILLAGMDKITVELGQFVLSGEPVAVMGQGPQLVSSVGLGTAQPILYVEFRKDGNSIDPTPWWATSESEKARG